MSMIVVLLLSMSFSYTNIQVSYLREMKVEFSAFNFIQGRDLNFTRTDRT